MIVLENKDNLIKEEISMDNPVSDTKAALIRLRDIYEKVEEMHDKMFRCCCPYCGDIHSLIVVVHKISGLCFKGEEENVSKCQCKQCDAYCYLVIDNGYFRNLPLDYFDQMERARKEAHNKVFNKGSEG